MKDEQITGEDQKLCENEINADDSMQENSADETEQSAQEPIEQQAEAQEPIEQETIAQNSTEQEAEEQEAEEQESEVPKSADPDEIMVETDNGSDEEEDLYIEDLSVGQDPDDDRGSVDAEHHHHHHHEEQESDDEDEAHHHHHHHHHHGRHHRVPLIGRILIGVLIVFLCLGGTALAAWQIMNQVGKNELYAGASSSGPDLTASAANSAASEGENWQPGWVRYNGSVYEYNTNVLTFLIMGIDSDTKVRAARDGISGNQADAVFLLVADPDTKTFSLIAINRNTMTDIDVYDKNGAYVGSGKGQICLQHGYGDGKEQSCLRMEKAVSNLFYQLPINGYCAINMGAISEINDAVGGVTLEVLDDCTAWDSKLAKGKTVTLKGKEALSYTRYRDENEFDSASARLKRQEQYLGAFAQQLKSGLKKDPSLALNIYNTITPYMVTDIDASKITYMATNMNNYSFDSSRIYSLKGTTAIGKTKHEEFTYDEQQLYDLIIKVFYQKVEGIQ